MMNFKRVTGLVFGLVAVMSGLTAKEHTVYDYIIVGNGTAGAVLARKLSDDNKTTVLVLEAGIDLSNDPVVLTASGPNFINDINEATISQRYAETFVVPGFVPLQSFSYSQGRGWGGSSLHNYLEAIRGTPSFYDQMAAIAGNASWSYNSLLPLMQALENYTSCQTVANAAQRGTGGPISITQALPVNTDPLGILLAGPHAGNAGFIADLNDPTQPGTTGFTNIGFSAYQYFATSLGPCTVGQRSYSANTFINPSIVDSNGDGRNGRLLRIKSNAFVSRVLFDGTKAKGVEFTYGKNADKNLKAYGKKIILCAGAINTPAILQRSGVGDPAILNPLGIDVVVNNPNVGANLICQYGPNAIFSGVTNAQPFLQGTINCSGVVTSGFNYPNVDTRVVQLVALQAVPPNPSVPTGLAQSIGFILQPSSRGSVQIVSKSPLVQPNVDLNMYSDGPVTTLNTDANKAVASLYLVEQAVVGGGGFMVYPTSDQFTMGPAALLQAAQASSGISIADHICGTTRMGASSATAVVDANLNVFGVKNLMIADLGVAPISPDGNTCYAVYMIGLNAARILGIDVPPAL